MSSQKYWGKNAVWVASLDNPKLMRVSSMNDPNAHIKRHVKTLVIDLANSLSVTLKNVILNDTIVAGGCFKSLLLKQPVKDYDFFFKTTTSRDKFVELVMLESNLKFFSKTNNAITIDFNGYIIQFITLVTGKPRDIVKTFDFLHCMNFYDIQTDEFEIQHYTIAAKNLSFNPRSKYPISAMSRMNRLVSEGWKMKEDNLIYLAFAINNVFLGTEAALKDQLRGMYGAGSDYLIKDLMKRNKKFENKLEELIKDEDDSKIER